MFYADRFIDKIINRVDQLEIHAHSGRMVPEFGLEILKELVEGNYRIVYRVATDTITMFESITQPDFSSCNI